MKLNFSIRTLRDLLFTTIYAFTAVKTVSKVCKWVTGRFKINALASLSQGYRLDSTDVMVVGETPNGKLLYSGIRATIFHNKNDAIDFQKRLQFTEDIVNTSRLVSTHFARLKVKLIKITRYTEHGETYFKAGNFIWNRYKPVPAVATTILIWDVIFRSRLDKLITSITMNVWALMARYDLGEAELVERIRTAEAERRASERL